MNKLKKSLAISLATLTLSGSAPQIFAARTSHGKPKPTSGSFSKKTDYRKAIKELRSELEETCAKIENLIAESEKRRKEEEHRLEILKNKKLETTQELEKLERAEKERAEAEAKAQAEAEAKKKEEIITTILSKVRAYANGGVYQLNYLYKLIKDNYEIITSFEEKNSEKIKPIVDFWNTRTALDYDIIQKFLAPIYKISKGKNLKHNEIMDLIAQQIRSNSYIADYFYRFSMVSDSDKLDYFQEVNNYIKSHKKISILKEIK